MSEPDLPVAAVLPDVLDALSHGPGAVLVAAPGAGKTTMVPLALMAAPWASGRIVVLEPRRLAARASARRMASLLGENLGERVGLAMRMEHKVSARTRVLVITEGVLSRMILDDPELRGVSAIIFDEFHERSLDGDFGLALALDVQSALRPDLRLLVMSATLDTAAVATLLDGAPVIESRGRSFPVTLRHEDPRADTPISQTMANVIARTVTAESGNLLAFLPGQREIEQTKALLAHRLAPEIEVFPLFGALDAAGQEKAIGPAPPGRRKVVLATSVAETSLTIDDVHVVVDCGLARLPRYEPAAGLTRLETVKVSRASADQRAGRAGRVRPGVAIRLWRSEQTAALPAFTRPEIMSADLSHMMLDCAAFGVTDPTALRFLDQPPQPALREARALLLELRAIDENGQITANGKAIRSLALPVRLAHMVLQAARSGQARDAAELAVILTERGLGGNVVDLERRLAALRKDRTGRARAARALAERLARTASELVKPDGHAGPPASVGALLVQAWPNRVAMARGAHGHYVLAGGRGAVVDAAEPLAAKAFLVVAELQGRARNARVLAAAAIEPDEVRSVLADRLERRVQTEFDPDKRTLRASETIHFGAILLARRPLPAPHGVDADRLVLAAIRTRGLSLLSWDSACQALRARLDWLHRRMDQSWPDMSDQALLETLDDWLLPFLSGEASLAKIEPRTLRAALMARVPFDLGHRLDSLAPTHFVAPSGSRLPIRYSGDQAVLAVRVQELFGLDHHPHLADGTQALTLELLSPAHRVIQTTRDLPGFWRGSWRDVRAAMRGRYPRHAWPEDPLSAEPTSRARPRGK